MSSRLTWGYIESSRSTWASSLSETKQSRLTKAEGGDAQEDFVRPWMLA